uniref:E3 ubiquitin-protein ligase XIAP n=1 Tax=Poecilia formosa TaxID=48698 RepID=A0A087XNI6_POEFO
MSEQGEYSNLESDGCPDFSKFDNRFQSFRGSTLARQVPPERLARAGFYFTGDADRVQCFSCNQTVENWHSGDTPVQRHKEVSPSCRFLVCSHPNSMKPNYITPLIYDEVAEDMQYRVSTGEVVDETLYPRIPHMKSEQVRLDTFSSWPSTAPVRPRDLAQAGFYYLGQADRVECFCCGNKLNNWENGDRPWEEHATHFPNCFFILGHDVGNVPLLDNSDEPMLEDQNVNQGRNMETFEGRLSSFAHVRHPVDHERLARAGFYSTVGQEDQVLCFCCGGGLKGWQPDEDPWEEHAKEYPGRCSFLLEEKGAAFVNSIQLKGIEQRSAVSMFDYLIQHKRSLDILLFSMKKTLIDDKCLSFQTLRSVTVSKKLFEFLRNKAFPVKTSINYVQFRFVASQVFLVQDFKLDLWFLIQSRFDNSSLDFSLKVLKFDANIMKFCKVILPHCPMDANKHCASLGFVKYVDNKSQRVLFETKLITDPCISLCIAAALLLFLCINPVITVLCISLFVQQTTPFLLDEDPMEKLMKLQREKQCKICMDRDICIVFIPCGHLVSCKQCSESLVKCPICCGAIAQKIKAYIG